MRLCKKPIIVALAIIFIFAFATNITAQTQPIEFDAYFGLGEYGFDSGYIGLDEVYARMQVRVYGMLALTLANVSMDGSVWVANGEIGVTGTPDGGEFYFDIGFDYGAYAYYGIPVLNLDYEIDLLDIVGLPDPLRLNDSESFTPFLLDSSKEISGVLLKENVFDADLSEFLFPGIPFAAAGVTIDGDMELHETLEGESIYFSNPGSSIFSENSTLSFSGSSTILSYNENATVDLIVGVWPGLYAEAFGYRFDFAPLRIPITVYSADLPLAFNNCQANFGSSDINIKNLSIAPSTVAPYESVQVGGYAEYNMGDPVAVGTAEISVDGSVWTASVSNGNFSRTINAPSSQGTWPVGVYVYDGLGLNGSSSINLHVTQGSSSNYDVSWVTTCGDYWEDDNGDVHPTDVRDYFSPTESGGLISILRVHNLTTQVRAKAEMYRPDGTLAGEYTWPDWTEDWWDFAWWPYGWWDNVPQLSQSGEWNVKWYIQPYGGSFQHAGSRSFIYRYNFIEHKMADGVNTDTCEPINPKNVFSPADVWAYTWMNLEGLSEDISVRWEWYNPEGSLETTYDADPISSVWTGPWDPPYDYACIWGNMGISGYSPAYKCGNWRVDVKIKDPWGNWHVKYTDHFRIEEHTLPSVSVAASPESPRETQTVTLNISSSDNNHLDKIVLHWNDGSNHTQMWDNINSSSYNPSHNIGSYSGDTQIEFWAEAWDESGNRAESEHYTFTVIPESITIPDRPSGEKYPQIDISHTYNTGGSTSSLGHSVEYQFEWGDGIQSGWGSAAQSHAWSNEGVYFVRTRARCQVHTERISSWSTPFTVCVDSTKPIVDITTNSGSDFETNQSQIILEGTTTDPDPASGLASVSINTGVGNEGTLYDWQFTANLNEGPNTFVVSATDNAGNIGSDTITVTYIPVISITVTTSPAARQITADSVDYTAPQTFNWESSSQHTIGVASPQSGGAGTRYVYDHWSDGSDQSHSIIIPSSDATYTAYFTTQYSLTTSANPPEGGVVTPSGTTWHDSGAQVDITPTPNTGYEFSGWSSDASGSDNPLSVTMDSPKNIVANFTCVTPAAPANPSPGDGATDVSTNTDLNWDDSNGATSYDVYFDTTYPPAKVGTVMSSAYNPGILNDDTIYYWRIVAKNDCDDTTGDLWQFTTGQQINCTILHKDGAIWSSDTGWEMGTPPYYPDTDYARDLELKSGNDTILIDEDFEGTFPPSGWTVVDNAGSGGVWKSNISWPRDNYTGGAGNCAAADSDAFELISMDTELRTPAFNLSSVSSAELRFNVDYVNYSGSEYGDVDISTNGGSTWTNLVRYQGADVSGLVTLDITPYCGNANVMIRFHYGNAYYDWWFQVDDVQVALEAYTILHKDGALWSNITGWDVDPSHYYPSSNYAVDLEITDNGKQIIVHQDGALWSSDTGWVLSKPPYYAGSDYARALEVRTDDSYVVLHKEGALYDSASGWVTTKPPYYPGSEWAVDLKLDESGYVLLHRDGGLWSSAGGWVLDTPPYYAGSDYARALELIGESGYVILHKDGAIYDSVDGWYMDTPPYYPGTEYARDLEVQ